MTARIVPERPLQKYTRIAVVLHWLIAGLIAVNLCLVWFVDDVPEALTRPFIDTHKSIGITVLGLACMRLLWRFAHPPPPLPLSYHPWERAASRIAHVLLYCIIFLLPFSGWLHDSAWKDAAAHPMTLFGLIPWPRIGLVMNLEPATKESLHNLFFKIHLYLAYALYALVVLHIAAALKHQFFEKQAELERMFL